MAYATRKPGPGLIFHSDRGCQYASHEGRHWLTANAMRQSMSGTGSCYDNAPMESFWHSMKVEETHGQDFATQAEAKHCVFGYIEGDWYAPKEVPSGDNTTRLHLSLGYQSPAQFEHSRNAELIEAAHGDLPTALRNKSQGARPHKRAA